VSKRYLRYLVIGLALALAVSAVGCAEKAPPLNTTPPTETEEPAVESVEPSSPGVTPEVTELKIEDLVVGTGTEAKSGDTVSVHYTGWLTDGTKFDSSFNTGQPFQFALGQGSVIAGWDEGVEGMKVGGTRKLIIPPDKGYGAQGAGGVIPPNATLVFEVQLLGVN